MCNRIPGQVVRFACILSVSTLLTVGPVGCGESAPETGTKTEVSPEMVKANDNMKNFMDQQKGQKKAH